MAIQFSNLASTTLASGVSDTATSLSVTSASSFPSLGGSDYFYASIGIGSGSEIVKVTAISGTTLTVTRGQDNTTAISHASGAEISLRVTAGALEDLRDGGQVYTAGSGITLSGNAFSLTDKSNYDTAYGWGDHSQEGYLTSYTDTNTTYTAGSGITLTGTTFSLTDKTNYDTAYGWGDHAQAGYLTSYTDTNTTYTAGSGITLTGTTFSLTDKANYDTAYGWGDHSQAGYLTSYTDTNTTYTAGSGITLTGTVFSLTDKANYDTAYGWGDHGAAGYLTSHQSLSGYATETYVGTQISALVDSAPSALDTLNELAAALGDDANFSTTVTNSIATKLPLAGGTLTGNLSLGDNTKAIFGAGSDLSIYHDGNHSFLEETGTGALKLKGDDIRLEDSSGNNIIKAASSSAELYEAGSKKLETTSSGIVVTGSVTATSADLRNTSSGAETTALSLRNYAAGANTATALNFYPTQSTTRFASIVAENTDGNNNIALSFLTSAGDTPTAALTIDQNRRVLIGTSTVAYAGTQLNIGDTSDAENGVQIQSATNGTGYVLFGDGAGAAAYRGQINYVHATDHMAFHAAGGEAMRITSSGYIHMAGASDVRLTLGSTGTAGNNSANWVRGNGASLSYNAASANHIWEIGGDEKMRITSAGDVYISQTNGSSTTVGHIIQDNGKAFHIADGNNPLHLTRLNSDGDIQQFYLGTDHVGSVFNSGTTMGIGSLDTGVLLANNIDAILPWNASTNAERGDAIDLGRVSSGRFKDLHLSGTANAAHVNVGGGTVADPTVTIDSASGGDPTLVFDTGATNRSAIIRFKDQGTTSAFINYHHQHDRMDFGTGSSTGITMSLNGGNLLIGKTTSGVSGAGVVLRGGGELFVTRAGDVMNLNRLSTDGEIAAFRKDGLAVGRIGTEGGDLYLGTDDANIKFYNSEAIQPVNSVGGVRDNAIDLGASSARFRSAYLSGTVRGGVETAVTSTSTTITSGTHLYVSAAGRTITLPASPSQGAKAHITVGNFTDTVVARNGSNIMGSASDMTLDAAYLSIQFIYVDATRGWVMA